MNIFHLLKGKLQNSMRSVWELFWFHHEGKDDVEKAKQPSILNILVFQYGNITCTGRNMNFPCQVCKHKQHGKEAWLGILCS
jgi:hypothetical protein